MHSITAVFRHAEAFFSQLENFGTYLVMRGYLSTQKGEIA